VTGKQEFCSDAWIDEVERILSELVADAGESLRGRKITVCEVFTDPPAHLLRPGEDRVYWYCEVEEGRAHVAREDRPADYRVVVDYQATLPGARSLHDTPRGDPNNPLAVLFFHLHNRLAVITA
jgi:hypothetical protein